MTFAEAVKTCLTKSILRFQEELHVPSSGCIGVVSVAAQQDLSIVLMGLLVLLMISPLFCAQIRRLHDAGFSGWFVLLSLISYIGGIALLVMTLLKSDSDNKWGPNPQSTIE